MENELPPAEKRALTETNSFLNAVYQKVLSDMHYAGVPDGKSVTLMPNGRRLILDEGKHQYRYFESKDQWMFCYTPWKDEDGNYWSWIYRPVGKGSRTGDPRRWRMTKPLKSRKRKTASARAERMYKKHTA